MWWAGLIVEFDPLWDRWKTYIQGLKATKEGGMEDKAERWTVLLQIGNACLGNTCPYCFQEQSTTTVTPCSSGGFRWLQSLQLWLFAPASLECWFRGGLWGLAKTIAHLAGSGLMSPDLSVKVMVSLISYVCISTAKMHPNCWNTHICILHQFQYIMSSSSIS